MLYRYQTTTRRSLGGHLQTHAFNGLGGRGRHTELAEVVDPGLDEAGPEGEGVGVGRGRQGQTGDCMPGPREGRCRRVVD